MLNKLNIWFSGLSNHENIDKENQVFYVSFAVVMFHVIKADGIQSKQEEENFLKFFQEYFELEKNVVKELYKDLLKLEGDFEKHLVILKEELKSFPSEKIKLMNEINSMIQVDGINEREYEVFEKVRVGLI